MMKHGNSRYFNWVITRFMPSILSCITEDVPLHQLIEALSISSSTDACTFAHKYTYT